MNQKLERAKPTTDQPGSDFDSWRSEIEAFCRQTISDLQEMIASDPSVDVSSDVNKPKPATPTIDDVPGGSIPRGETKSNPRAVESTISPAAAPLDLDSSQDRLATLRRELAAKLSKANRTDE